MWIPGLDSPHREHSFELLNVPFAPFSRSILYTFTLGRTFAPLTISCVYLGYRYAITNRISGLDSPHRYHSFDLLNVPFALFPRYLLYTFTLGQTFEPLTILYVYLSYRHAITKWIPGLDSPHRYHLSEPLDVPFAPCLGLLASIFHLLVLVVA